MSGKSIFQMAEHHARADQLTDGELVDEVVKHVWAEFGVSTYASALIDELTERFMEAKGILETPHGITRDGEKAWPDVIG